MNSTTPESGPETAVGAPPRLRMIGVRKKFDATIALQGVSMTADAGEVHALIGENGAGKSTLMKILSGACSPDEGTIEIDGKPFAPRSPSHGRQCGIAMIYQELNLAPDLTVQENIVLGAEPHAAGWIKRGDCARLARAALAELRHEQIPLQARVRNLTIAEKQIVEIARALVGDSKVLIMDEPTSSLTQADVENLFAAIDRLRRRGVTIIYISHFLEECRQVATHFTVLRDGATVGSGEMKSAGLAEIIRLMVGREIREIYPRTPRQFGAEVLRLERLAGLEKPRAVDLVLRQGEILGIAGLVGAGRTETLRTLFGLDKSSGGRVFVFGQEETFASPSGRLARGMGLLSENRKEEGLLLNRSLADNLTLSRFKAVATGGFVSSRRQADQCGAWMKRLNVRARGPKQPMIELSGGNQQKIALARLLYHDANILLLDEPTRGIDVGSKAEIYRLMGELAAQGKAVIFVSSYLPELLGICDTIGVMCRGVLSGLRPASDWTEHEIMTVATAKGTGS